MAQTRGIARRRERRWALAQRGPRVSELMNDHVARDLGIRLEDAAPAAMFQCFRGRSPLGGQTSTRELLTHFARLSAE
eukprot:7876703-Pyramimonas_sp.AAC.1